MKSSPETWIDESVGTAQEAVSTTSGRGIGPTELVEVLVPGCDPWVHLNRVLRINQWIERKGEYPEVFSDRPARLRVCA